MAFHAAKFLKVWLCCSCMAGHYPGARVQLWVCFICVISTCSNGAVQIRVGLELADQVRGRNSGWFWKGFATEPAKQDSVVCLQCQDRDRTESQSYRLKVRVTIRCILKIRTIAGENRP